MHQRLVLTRLVFVTVGAIAISIGGCASEETATAPSPSPTASPAAAKPGTQPFAKPLVAQKPANSPAVPGLIQPTNADERAKQVQASIDAQKTKKDPFASLPVVLQRPTPPRGAPKPAARPTTVKPGAKPNPGRNRTPFPPGTPVLPNRAAPMPPPPTTNLATAVEVSGVVYVNGTAQAIVKAPNEGSSRYVKVGQRLADGQVLVKRIEMNSGSDPIVILEENGVEVSKIVGEKVAPASGRAV